MSTMAAVGIALQAIPVTFMIITVVSMIKSKWLH